MNLELNGRVDGNSPHGIPRSPGIDIHANTPVGDDRNQAAMTKSNVPTRDLSNTLAFSAPGRQGSDVMAPRVICHTLLRIRGGIVGVNGRAVVLIRSTSNIHASWTNTWCIYPTLIASVTLQGCALVTATFLLTNSPGFREPPPTRPEETRENTHSERPDSPGTTRFSRGDSKFAFRKMFCWSTENSKCY